MSGNATPANVGSNDGLGPLPITRHDHPEPQTMVWSELELHAIRAYAARCVAAERERVKALVAALEWIYGMTTATPALTECGLGGAMAGIGKAAANALGSNSGAYLEVNGTSLTDLLRADLISCRGTVKTEMNHYERQAMVHGKTPHGATYEAEAQRLRALLERIDALGA